MTEKRVKTIVAMWNIIEKFIAVIPQKKMDNKKYKHFKMELEIEIPVRAKPPLDIRRINTESIFRIKRGTKKVELEEIKKLSLKIRDKLMDDFFFVFIRGYFDIDVVFSTKKEPKLGRDMIKIFRHRYYADMERIGDIKPPTEWMGLFLKENNKDGRVQAGKYINR